MLQGPADNSTASASAAATSNNSMHGILSPLDELHYWADLAAAGTGGTGAQQHCYLLTATEICCLVCCAGDVQVVV